MLVFLVLCYSKNVNFSNFVNFHWKKCFNFRLSIKFTQHVRQPSKGKIGDKKVEVSWEKSCFLAREKEGVSIGTVDWSLMLWNLNMTGKVGWIFTTYGNLAAFTQPKKTLAFLVVSQQFLHLVLPCFFVVNTLVVLITHCFLCLAYKVGKLALFLSSVLSLACLYFKTFKIVLDML